MSIAELRGVSGWLGAMAVSLMLPSANGIRRVWSTWVSLNRSHSQLISNPSWQDHMIILAGSHFVQLVVAGVAAALLTWRLQRSTPRLVTWMMVLQVLTAIALPYMAYAIFVGEPPIQVARESLLFVAPVYLLELIVWGVYLARSRRVKNTYGTA